MACTRVCLYKGNVTFYLSGVLINCNYKLCIYLIDHLELTMMRYIRMYRIYLIYFILHSAQARRNNMCTRRSHLLSPMFSLSHVITDGTVHSSSAADGHLDSLSATGSDVAIILTGLFDDDIDTVHSSSALPVRCWAYPVTYNQFRCFCACSLVDNV